MGWPQIAYIALTAMGLGIALVKHGEPREPYSFLTQIIAAAIGLGLLYAGGFFSQ